MQKRIAFFNCQAGVFPAAVIPIGLGCCRAELDGVGQAFSSEDCVKVVDVVRMTPVGAGVVGKEKALDLAGRGEVCEVCAEGLHEVCMRWGRPLARNITLGSPSRQQWLAEVGAGIPMGPHGPALISLAGVVFGPSRQVQLATGYGPDGLGAANQRH